MTSTVGARRPEETADRTPGGSGKPSPADCTPGGSGKPSPADCTPGGSGKPSPADCTPGGSGKPSPASPQGAVAGSAPNGLSWLLDDILSKVPSARYAVLLSVDGLVLGCDTGLEGDGADHLAAVAAGLASLARGAGRRFEVGAVRSTVVEFDEAYLLISDAGNRTCLAVMTGADTDLGLLAYEAELMVARVGEHLATGAR